MRKRSGILRHEGNLNKNRLGAMQLVGIQEESEEERRNSASSASLAMSSAMFVNRSAELLSNEFSCDFGDFAEEQADEGKGAVQLALEQAAQLDSSTSTFAAASSSQDDEINHARRQTTNHGFSWEKTKSVDSGWESDQDGEAEFARMVMHPDFSQDSSLSSSSQSLEYRSSSNWASSGSLGSDLGQEKQVRPKHRSKQSSHRHQPSAEGPKSDDENGGTRSGGRKKKKERKKSKRKDRKHKKADSSIIGAPSERP